MRASCEVGTHPCRHAAQAGWGFRYDYCIPQWGFLANFLVHPWTSSGSSACPFGRSRHKVMDVSRPGELQALCEQSQQTNILAFACSLYSFSFVIICLRLYCKSQLGRGITADDYVIVASMVCSPARVIFGFIPDSFDRQLIP